MTGKRGSKLTVRAWVRANTTHANLRSALQKAIGNQAVSLRDAIKRTSDGKNSVVNTWNDLANTSSYTSLLTQVSDVLTGLANNDTSFLRGDNGTKSDLGLGVFLLGALRNAVGRLEAAHSLGDVLDTGVDVGGDFFRRHADELSAVVVEEVVE